MVRGVGHPAPSGETDQWTPVATSDEAPDPRSPEARPVRPDVRLPRMNDPTEKGEEPSSEGAEPSETIEHLRGALEDQDGAIEALSAKIYRFLYKKYRGVELSRIHEFDDLYIEVLEEFCMRLPTFKIEGRREFWSFIKKLAEHRIVSIKRSANAGMRDERRTLPGGAAGIDSDDAPPSAFDLEPSRQATASEEARANEIGQIERECLMQVEDSRQREIYMMRRFDGLPHAAIAEELNINPRTERWLYNVAKGRVIKCMCRKLDGYDLGLPEGEPDDGDS